MSLSQQTQHRLPTIKHGLLSGLTTAQIGDKLGVTEKTIDRDLRTFVQSGEFESWLKEEWLRLHNIILHEDPTEAYRNITKLVSKMLTQHTESLSEVKVEETHVSIVADYTNAIRDAANRDIQSLRAKQQVDTPEPQATPT